MNIPLGEGNFDAVFGEAVPDGEADGAADVGGSLFRITDPEPQFQIHGVVPEVFELAGRPRLLQYPVDVFDRFHQSYRQGYICRPNLPILWEFDNQSPMEIVEHWPPGKTWKA